jgi:hypothetical protein
MDFDFFKHAIQDLATFRQKTARRLFARIAWRELEAHSAWAAADPSDVRRARELFDELVASRRRQDRLALAGELMGLLHGVDAFHFFPRRNPRNPLKPKDFLTGTAAGRPMAQIR